jgi:hypothetical protein
VYSIITMFFLSYYISDAFVITYIINAKWLW